MADKKSQNGAVNMIAGIVGIVLLLAALVVYLIDPLMLNMTYTLLGIGLVALVFSLVQSWRSIAVVIKSGGARYTANMLLLSLVMLGILVVINFIADKNPKRFDVTAEGLFTISDQSEKVMKKVDRELNIIAFYGQSNPEDMASKARLTDIFESLKYINDFVKYRFIDPDKDPVSVKNYNITQDGPRIIITYDEKEERVKGVIEQAVINGIVRVTRKEQKILYFTFGHGEASLEDTTSRGYSELQKKLESEGYKVAVLSLIEAKEVPRNAGALVIAGPEKAFLEPEAKRVQEYVEKGGKLFYMVEPFSEPLLTKFLRKYGMEIENTLVVDPSSKVLGMGANVPIGQQYSDHPVTKGFHFATLYPTARSIKGIKADKGITTKPLVRTSPNAWGETNWQDTGDGSLQVTRDDDDIKGPLSLGVGSSTKSIRAEDKYSGEARIVVMGDRDFASNQFLKISGNADLAMNIFAWLSEEEDLISIRPKQRKSSRVFLTQRQGNFLNLFSQWVIPLFILIIGVAVWLVRRRK